MQTTGEQAYLQVVAVAMRLCPAAASTAANAANSNPHPATYVEPEPRSQLLTDGIAQIAQSYRSDDLQQRDDS